MPLVLLPVLALGVWVEGGPFLETFEKAATLQTVDPAALLYLNLVLGSMILVTWFSIRVIHRMRPRWLASVRPRLRWRFLLRLPRSRGGRPRRPGSRRCGCSPGRTRPDAGPLNDFTSTTAAIAVIVLLTTPFQAAGEEYLFRGYLLMAVGSLFANRMVGKWVAIVVTATLFALAHGGQNFPLFFDRFMFGLIAGWLVIRTGGLEAGIALHILNNFLAYGFALAFGDLTETLTVSRGELVEHPADAHPVRALRPSRGLGGAPDERRDDHVAAPGRRRSAARRGDGVSALTRASGQRLPFLAPTGWPCILVRASQEVAHPMGYGVIGSPTGSGPVSLGSSPSTPAIRPNLQLLLEFRPLQAPVV